LKIHTPGAGYCHFPADYTEEYFKQLTSERIQTKFINGHPTRIWIMPKGRRNEALDCRVYALAAYHILNPNMEALLKDQERDILNNKPDDDAQKQNKASDWIGYDDWNFT
jgi:phage terminase large subunit GpA-like protein